MSEQILRRLARDQWVRVHGTPRVTVLVGTDEELARRLWQEWLAAGALPGELFEGAVDEAVRGATARAIAEPQVPVAVVAAPDGLAAWRSGRRDRIAAMVEEGVLEVDTRAASAGPRARARAASGAMIDARSAAEAAMLEALEATPATAGRFELNGYLSVHFGAGAAEVDLLSRRDSIAIEIDGYHHFTDMDAYRRDRKKDLLLQLQGLIVIRLHAQDVTRDPRPGVAAVCQALAYRKEPRP